MLQRHEGIQLRNCASLFHDLCFDTRNDGLEGVFSFENHTIDLVPDLLWKVHESLAARNWLRCDIVCQRGARLPIGVIDEAFKDQQIDGFKISIVYVVVRG